MSDVNRDGILDVVTVNPWGALPNGGRLLLGTPGGGFAPPTVFDPGFALELALSDINGDNQLDIVTANWPDDEIGVMLGLGGTNFAPVNTYSVTGPNTPMQPMGVAVGDVNRDDRMDIVTANHGNYSVGVRLGQASGFAPMVNYPSGTGGPADDVITLSLADLNGDGWLDVVTVNVLTSTVGVLMGQASGRFAPTVAYSTGNSTRPRYLDLGDVNQDGQLDIITSNGGAKNASVLLGTTGGGYAPATFYDTGNSVASSISSIDAIKLGDVNGDGRLDMVVLHPASHTISIMLGQQGGSFAPPVSKSSDVVNGHDLELADVSGDGRLDIVVAGSQSEVAVLLNTGTFAPLATARPTAADIVLSPNPAHGAFTVQLPTAVGTLTSAELLGAMGQVVRRTGATSPRFTLETAGLAPGVYTLRLIAGATTVAKRVIVE